MTANRCDSQKPELSLRFFGPVEVHRNGAALPALRSRKGHWLLALLALRPGQTLERAWLAGSLWPESPEEAARHNLRNALTDLRRALGPEAVRLQAPTPQTLALDLTGAAVDVLAFDAAVRRGDRASRERAVALYRGPLLEGCAEEWVFAERQSRQAAFLQALEMLAREALALGAVTQAEGYLRRAVAVDPVRESVQRLLMELLAATGNEAAVLQLYRELRLRLHRDLNAGPDPETTALFRQLRAQARERAGARSEGPGVSSAVPSRPPDGASSARHPTPPPWPLARGLSLPVCPFRPAAAGWWGGRQGSRCCSDRWTGH